jgi:uncharacterized repeat protein (TIGR02543 family)
MSKSVKIIVISAVAVVVTLAIVLGCVFGIKCTVTFYSDIPSNLSSHYNTSESSNWFLTPPPQTKVTRCSTFSPFIPTHESAPQKITAINGVPVESNDNYTFAGWYKDSALTMPWSSTDRVTSDITLYAKWIKD